MKSFSGAKALFAILLVLLMVIGLSACGGTGGEADTTAPEVKLDRSTASNFERTRILSGTVEAGARVEVTANTTAVIGPVTVTANTWTCSVDLVPGANTLFVKASDSTGNNLTLSFVLTYEVFTLDAISLASSLTDQTLTGTLASGSNLAVSWTRTSTGEVISSPVITDANWSLELTGLANDSYSLLLEGTDGAGQKTSLLQTLVIDNTLPNLTVTPMTSPVSTDSLIISGTVADDATISLSVPVGVTISEPPTVPLPGTWAKTLSGLIPGRNQIDITATRASDGKQGTARRVVLYQPVNL